VQCFTVSFSWRQQ
jgi:serine/threonine protein kinase